MKLIQLFFEAIAKFMRDKEGKDAGVLRLELDNLYKKFLKQQPDEFHDMGAGDIIMQFEADGDVYKIEILAELIYQDALLDNGNKKLLEKSLALFRYVSQVSNTFSFDRNRKIGEIESILSI